MTAPVVVGIDCSTQSTKAVVRRLDDGVVMRQASATHPPGTEVDPAAWERALSSALDATGGLDDHVVGVGIAAQQHGLVTLDDVGAVVRPALLWNDTRSAGAAADLVDELGASAWAEATGSVPLASFTVAKLRWMAEHEPAEAERVAAVCLPHDWLTWRLLGAGGIDTITTDRGDASGTGYWSPSEGRYRPDLLRKAFGRGVAVPEVLAPWSVAGEARPGLAVSAGTGDNMAAALGVGAAAGEAVISIGTSGVVAGVAESPTNDASGIVAGFADATGRYLPLACTLNGAPVLVQVARLLGCDLARLGRLALSADPGSGGLVFVPYLSGERTPNLPGAHGEVTGMSMANTTSANLARAAVEGLLCGLADGLDALVAQGVEIHRVLLVGGGARSDAVRQIAATVFDADVVSLESAEYVALGAATQAARALAGGAEPAWAGPGVVPVEGSLVPEVRERYREEADRVAAISRP